MGDSRKGALYAPASQGGQALRFAALVLACLVVALALTACSGGGGGGGGGNAAATGSAFTQPSTVPMPEVNLPGGTAIDTSHANDGYIAAQGTNAARLKFQVAKGDMTYNYDLPNDGSPTVFPVNMGDGEYLLRIMQNTEGSNYVEIASENINVKLANEFAPFLYPNVFCNYTPSSNCIAKARELTANAENQGEAVKAVCSFLVENISYDNAKAEKLSNGTGYIPNPDDTLSTKTGICFDYASLGAAMLRSQGFPTKIITGYVGKESLYHAWIMVYVDGAWQSAEISVNPNTWSRVDITFASAGNSKYVGDGSAYTDRYTY